MIDRTLGHYRILEHIGAGGMGVVYRARDERLERDVALKILPAGALADEEMRKRFRREALALSKLSHPNIAVIHDFNSEQGVDFLAMEYISGMTLGEKVHSGAMPEAEVIQVGKQIAEALEAAHEQGLIHRDLKPGNIMITPKGLVKVLDFGLAKLFQPSGKADVTLTQTGTNSMSGTLPYMAPEQFEGGEVDARTDIHALGAILYELATGKRLFPQETASRIIHAILQGQPEIPRISGTLISEGLERIIRKCLEKDPADRYASAGELTADLKLLESGRLAALTAARPGRGAKRRPLRIALPLGASVMILASVLFALNVGGMRRLLLGGPETPAVRSLAVLPLESLSADPQQDYLADGMTDTLITELGQLSTLQVTSRTSVSRYKKTEKSLPQIAQELKVDLVVEGSVLSSGGSVKITAKLIRPAEERQLWVKSYERQMGEFMVLQSEIAADITRQIGIRLSEEANLQLAKKKTLNPKAVDLYLKGVYSDDVEYFLQAVRIEPDFALAYAKIASSYFYGGLFGSLPPREAFSKMKQAALAGLEKDDTLGEAHGYLAVASLHYDLDWKGAEKEFKRAFALNASLADLHHLYAHHLMAMGRTQESMEEVNLASALDPFSWDQSQCFGWHCFYTKGYDEAIELALQGIKTNSENAWAHVILGWAYEQKSMIPEAIHEFQTASSQWKNNPLPLAALGHAYGLAGKNKDARAILERLLDMAKKKYVPAYDIAVVYAGLGEDQAAMEWLTKAFEERSGFVVYIKCDRRFDGLRSNPGFDVLLKRMGLPS